MAGTIRILGNKLDQWRALNQTLGDFMMCMGMCGSGCKTYGVGIIRILLLLGRILW